MVHTDSKHKKKQKKPAEPSYAIKGRIWIDGPEWTYISYGRIVLMERIIEHGSITKAAKSMEMSYRHAWELIDSMNSQAPEPFVLTSTGGKKGGGTIVTDEGKRAIKKFWKAYSALEKFLKKENLKLDYTGEMK